MGEPEEATLESQFYEFARYLDVDKNRDGTAITLYRSDFWLRQGKIIDDRKLNMTDTGLMWWKYAFEPSKAELNYQEWYEYLTELCASKEINQEETEIVLTNCGLPGQSPCNVPQYRDFFDNYKPKTSLDLG